MKKQITFAMVALATIAVQAQDVDVKKGIISINKTQVGKIEREKLRYKISSLDGKTFFWAEVKVYANHTTAGTTWLQLTGENGNIHDLENKSTTFTLSREKQAIYAVQAGTEFFTQDGINKEKVDELFQTSNTAISNKTKQLQNDLNQLKAHEDSIVKRDKISVAENGDIKRGSEKIGFIQTTTVKQVYAKHTAKIADIKGQVIAEVTYDELEMVNTKNGVKITTYDGKVLELNDLGYFMNNTDPGRANPIIVTRLYANGYKFGDMTQEINNYKSEKYAQEQEKRSSDLAAAKSNSRNIYDAPGYVINKKGEKQEGLITIEFESVGDRGTSLGSKASIADLSSYGNTVSIKVNGKKSTFKSKDNIEFGVANERYLGVTTSEDGGLGNSNGELDIFGGSSKFLIVDYDKEGHMILHHMKTPNGFYLLLKGQKKAVYLGDKSTFGKRKEETTKKIFDKYVNCGALNFENYDTNTQDGLKKLIDDYIQSCQ
jgi:hypothetical protein